MSSVWGDLQGVAQLDQERPMPHTPEAGSTGYFRKLTFADQTRFRDHLLRLDPGARRARFAMPASDAFLRCYAETSFSLPPLFGLSGGHLVNALPPVPI